MHTPVSIYLKVRDMYPQSALMESSDYHAGENSLSFIALCPLASIGVNGGIVTANYPDNSRTEEPLTKTFNVEKAMNRFINKFQVTGDNKNVCGLYGYTTFNAVKYFEHIPVKESHDEQNDAPDLLYILYKYVIVFNHFKNELTLVEMLSEGEESGLYSRFLECVFMTIDDLFSIHTVTFCIKVVGRTVDFFPGTCNRMTLVVQVVAASLIKYP